MTASLPQPGQRTPSRQRCWRTSAKHLASSSKAERLTRSMAAMMAEAPRTSPSATPTLAFRPDHPQPRAPSRPHHPERRQEPSRIPACSSLFGPPALRLTRDTLNPDSPLREADAGLHIRPMLPLPPTRLLTWRECRQPRRLLLTDSA